MGEHENVNLIISTVHEEKFSCIIDFFSGNTVNGCSKIGSKWEGQRNGK